MNPDVFQQKSSNLYAANQVLKFGFVVMALTTFLTVCVAGYAIMTHKTVFIFPGIDKEVWVSDNDASDEYIISFAKYALFLLCDYHPANVRSQYADLRLLISSDYFSKFDSTLKSNEETIKKLGVANAFYPQSVTIEKGERTVTVKGIKRQFAQDSEINSGVVGYKIKYVIKNRRLYINEISEFKVS